MMKGEIGNAQTPLPTVRAASKAGGSGRAATTRPRPSGRSLFKVQSSKLKVARTIPCSAFSCRPISAFRFLLSASAAQRPNLTERGFLTRSNVNGRAVSTSSCALCWRTRLRTGKSALHRFCQIRTLPFAAYPSHRCHPWLKVSAFRFPNFCFPNLLW